MKAGLWIGIGVGIALMLVVVSLVVGGMFINRQVWAGAPAVTPQTGGGWGFSGWPGCGGMGYLGAAPGTGVSGCPGTGWGGRWGRGTVPTSTLTLEDARQAVERYIIGLGLPNLEIAEVMEFENNFYAIVREPDTGIGAMELLVDKWNGAVGPEMGPNMMWNGKYGMHRGGWMMMGGSTALANTITPEEAAQIAQRWLDVYRPGATVEDADPFYGYYTIHTLRDGEIEGMLSVHGTTGQVWYHTWHGRFVRMMGEEE